MNEEQHKDEQVKQEAQGQASSDRQQACHRHAAGGQKRRTDSASENTREENDQMRDETIREYGQLRLEKNAGRRRIHLLSVIGEIEGHENLSSSSKATKYDHVLPKLAQIEDDQEIEGLLVLLNTSGGDIDAGLAIAEMIASLSIPSVSLVLGGSHSIGGPLAVSADYSFIVPSGTMIVHPVRMSGTVLGAPQTYEYFKRIQDRITGFMSSHSRASKEQLEQMMTNAGELTKDLGTILIGEEAVTAGLICEVGGLKEALGKLYELIDVRRQSRDGDFPKRKNTGEIRVSRINLRFIQKSLVRLKEKEKKE